MLHVASKKIFAYTDFFLLDFALFALLLLQNAEAVARRWF